MPALKLEDGQVLTEDIAILSYLAAGAPDQTLVPADALARARVLEWMSFLATGLHVNYSALQHPGTHVVDPACVPSVKADAGRRMQADLADVESHMRLPFLVGDAFTVADAHLFVFYAWGRWRHLVDEAETPKLQAWGAAMLLRSSVQRMIALEGIHIR